jgi:hypothetical protein
MSTGNFEQYYQNLPMNVKAPFQAMLWYSVIFVALTGLGLSSEYSSPNWEGVMHISKTQFYLILWSGWCIPILISILAIRTGIATRNHAVSKVLEFLQSRTKVWTGWTIFVLVGIEFSVFNQPTAHTGVWFLIWDICYLAIAFVGNAVFVKGYLVYANRKEHERQQITNVISIVSMLIMLLMTIKVMSVEMLFLIQLYRG